VAGKWRSWVGSTPTYCPKDRRFESRQRWLFELMTLRWFNVLRSAHTLNHLTNCKQASKLDQLVTIQSMAINTHGTNYSTTTSESWTTATHHSQEEAASNHAIWINKDASIIHPKDLSSNLFKYKIFSDSACIRIKFNFVGQ
jgi:hypothetical protein